MNKKYLNIFVIVLICIVCLLYITKFHATSPENKTLTIKTKYTKYDDNIMNQIKKKTSPENKTLNALTINAKYTKYDDNIMNEIKKLIDRKTKYNDPDVIALLRRIIDQPAERNHIKLANPMRISPQASVIDAYLKQKRNGFFVEAGSYDGEQLSNTVFFEKERGWTGLLIEMDPFYYMQMIGKNRVAYGINACISLNSGINLVPYTESENWLGKVDMTVNKKITTFIPCFPLASMLIAINVSRVDYFSLDVEGFELPVLKSVIPDKNIQIDLLSVEYLHGDKAGLKKYMEANNYRVFKEVKFFQKDPMMHADDFIFVKN